MEEDDNLVQFADDCWNDVFLNVQDAAVFLDNVAAECLHWNMGDKAFLFLRDAGASSIHELNWETLDKDITTKLRKATVICTSEDSSFYKKVVKRLIDNNNFEEMYLVSSVHPSVLDYQPLIRGNNDKSSFNGLKEDISLWMNSRDIKQAPKVDVEYRPIFTASISQSFLATPKFIDMFPLIDGRAIDVDDIQINYFVNLMHSMFANLNMNEDIYFMGSLGEIVADKLERLPAAADRRFRLSGRKNVSLILMDRTLDLCTAASHNTESVLGRILFTLPHLPHHSNDVFINMSAIFPAKSQESSKTLPPGCLATSDSSLINLLAKSKQTEVLLKLNKDFIDLSATIGSPKGRLATRISVHSLEKQLLNYREAASFQKLVGSSKLLQCSLAVIQSLKSNKTAEIELLISLEKLILQNLTTSRDSTSILSQLSNIINTRKNRGLQMENLIALLIHVYSLAGTEIHFSNQQEELLESTLTKALAEDVKTNQFFEPLISYEFSEETFLDDVKILSQRIMTLLRKVSEQRKSLNYKSLISKPSPQEMAQCTSLLQRLITDLLNPAKFEIADLQKKTSSVISAGFDFLLKGKIKNHPSDNPLIIIYIFGGVTAEELKIIEETNAKRMANQPRIVLAAPRLLTPLELVQKLLSTFRG